MDKTQVVREMTAELQREIDEITASPDVSQAVQSGDGDSEETESVRGDEAPYLVGAQLKRVKEAAELIDRLKAMSLKSFTDSSAVDLTALVEVEVDGEEKKWFFLVPQGGGMSIDVQGQRVLTLSPDSPLGQKLIGRSRGDDFAFVTKGDPRDYEIVAIK